MIRVTKWLRNSLTLVVSLLLSLITISTASAQVPDRIWSELSPTGTSPVPRYSVGTAYDEADDRLIFFGGEDFTGLPRPTDVWVLADASGAGGTPNWTQLTPSGGTPLGRVGGTTVYDSTHNRLIVHGGCSAGCSPALDDAWVLTNANGLGGTPTWIALPSAPIARANHAAIHDAANNRMIVFGGHTAFLNTDRNDVWVLTDANGIGNPTWIQLSPGGPLPPARSSESFIVTYDPVSNRLILFGGGQTVGNAFNDVWILSNANGLGGTPQWTELSPTGTPPTSRFGHSVVYNSFANQMIAFGGLLDDRTTHSNDVWILSNANGLGGTPEWLQVTPSGTVPAARWGHIAGYSASSDRMIVAMGRNEEVSPSLFNDVWVLSVASPSGDTAISITPSLEIVAVGAETVIEIRADNVQNLYGAQLELSFDPVLLEVVDAYDTVTGVQVEDGDFLNPDTTIHNAVDNGAGTIRYTVSLQGNKLGVSGSGVLARIRLRGLAVGTSAIDLTNVVLSDPNSGAIQSTQNDGQIEVKTVQVSGKVLLERRASNAGVDVCVAAQCVTATEDGSYTLLHVPTSETIAFRTQGYMRSEVTYSGALGDNIAIADVALLGGDVNQDDIIDITDANLIGQAWNSTPIDSHWDPRADITNDDVVNILDMVAVQRNWQQSFVATNSVMASATQSHRAIVRPGAATQVKLSPIQTIHPGIGEAIEMDVQVANVVDLYSFNIEVHFDPTVLQVKDMDPRSSAPGVQVRVGEFLDPANQFVVVNQVDNEAGIIELAVTQTHPAVAQSGSGVLSTISFEAIGEGRSAIEFVNAQLVDDSRPEPLTIAVDTQDGRVGSEEHNIFLPLLTR